VVSAVNAPRSTYVSAGNPKKVFDKNPNAFLHSSHAGGKILSDFDADI
jgi:hypothetical protein